MENKEEKKKSRETLPPKRYRRVKKKTQSSAHSREGEGDVPEYATVIRHDVFRLFPASWEGYPRPTGRIRILNEAKMSKMINCVKKEKKITNNFTVSFLEG